MRELLRSTFLLQKWIPITRARLSSADEYLSKDLYFGATIGRTAGRIADGSFELAGKKYQTMINTPPNNTSRWHTGFESKMAQRNPRGTSESFCEILARESCWWKWFSGNLTVSVTYTLTEENEWQIEYQATTDEQTLLIQPIMSTLI